MSSSTLSSLHHHHHHHTTILPTAQTMHWFCWTQTLHYPILTPRWRTFPHTSPLVRAHIGTVHHTPSDIHHSPAEIIVYHTLGYTLYHPDIILLLLFNPSSTLPPISQPLLHFPINTPSLLLDQSSQPSCIGVQIVPYRQIHSSPGGCGGERPASPCQRCGIRVAERAELGPDQWDVRQIYGQVQTTHWLILIGSYWYRLTVCLIDWLIDWLILIDCLIDWLFPLLHPLLLYAW